MLASFFLNMLIFILIIDNIYYDHRNCRVGIDFFSDSSSELLQTDLLCNSNIIQQNQLIKEAFSF